VQISIAEQRCQATKQKGKAVTQWKALRVNPEAAGSGLALKHSIYIAKTSC
jgi:hypothetical protein